MRHRSPKMLVFPSLGSQAEAAQIRPRDSVCPWNSIIYPETQKRSILFSTFTYLYHHPINKWSVPGAPSFLALFARRVGILTSPGDPDLSQALITDHRPPPLSHFQASRYPSHRARRL